MLPLLIKRFIDKRKVTVTKALMDTIWIYEMKFIKKYLLSVSSVSIIQFLSVIIDRCVTIL